MQDAEVTAASGCHQNCLEAMSCVKTIEVILEESRCCKIYFLFLLSLHKMYFTIHQNILLHFKETNLLIMKVSTLTPSQTIPHSDLFWCYISYSNIYVSIFYYIISSLHVLFDFLKIYSHMHTSYCLLTHNCFPMREKAYQMTKSLVKS